ncbi:MAG: DNA repair protein RecN [Clostridia bacterium]|nr:DNA repair protein RecN [Clostridia bacterium]
MLIRLRVENIALIDLLELEFSKGLNILTGETGAGKSIIIDSIGLILGERASLDSIKSGEKRARVEAVFDISKNHAAREYLASLDYEAEDELTISRELYASGRTVARINGIPSSAAIIKALTAHIVDIHGQHEHQSLLMPARHIHYLDAYGGKELINKRREVERIYADYRHAREELESEFMPEDERMRRIDMISYQINEIDMEGLRPGLEAELIDEQMLLSNAEHIMQALTFSIEALGGEEYSAVNAVGDTKRQLEDISDISSQYKDVAQRVSDAYYLLEDALLDVRHLFDDFEFDQQRLDEVGNKLFRISALKRKYGATVEDIISYRAEREAELTRLTQADERRHELERRVLMLQESYVKNALDLTSKRKAAASTLKEKVTLELTGLGMKNAAFSVVFSETDMGAHGRDKVEFFINTNAGEEQKPLSKVASGGELSRVMLALKTIIAGADDVDLLIFDEIDTGISGKTSSIVGEKLACAARAHQVLCVTHSPQIAAFADTHMLVEKHETEGHTSTNVRVLNLDERILEIARIMGGEGSKTAELHAKELILECENKKS